MGKSKGTSVFGLTFFSIGFLGVLIASLIILAVSCVTPSVRTPTCQELVDVAAKEAIASGYRLGDVQSGPMGELAVFVSLTTARVLFLTPSDDAAEYLAEKGWEEQGQCTTEDGSAATLMLRDFQVPLPASQEGRLNQRPTKGLCTLAAEAHVLVSRAPAG